MSGRGDLGNFFEFYALLPTVFYFALTACFTMRGRSLYS